MLSEIWYIQIKIEIFRVSAFCLRTVVLVSIRSSSQMCSQCRAVINVQRDTRKNFVVKLLLIIRNQRLLPFNYVQRNSKTCEITYN